MLTLRPTKDVKTLQVCRGSQAMNEKEVIDALATAPIGNTIPWGSLSPAGLRQLPSSCLPTLPAAPNNASSKGPATTTEKAASC